MLLHQHSITFITVYVYLSLYHSDDSVPFSEILYACLENSSLLDENKRDISYEFGYECMSSMRGKHDRHEPISVKLLNMYHANECVSEMRFHASIHVGHVVFTV